MKHQVDFLELLQINYEKYPVIAVVGGGGKTSLIYRLTDELIDKGKRVIITTTTHMAGESELPFARGGDAVRVKELLDKERYVIAAEYEEDTGKYASLTEEKLFHDFRQSPLYCRQCIGNPAFRRSDAI